MLSVKLLGMFRNNCCLFWIKCYLFLESSVLNCQEEMTETNKRKRRRREATLDISSRRYASDTFWLEFLTSF